MKINHMDLRIRTAVTFCLHYLANQNNRMSTADAVAHHFKLTEYRKNYETI